MESKNILKDAITFVFGVFLYSLCFNLLLNPNKLVVSGFSGISIITEKLFGWNPSIFLIVTNVFLLVICLIVLGKDKTNKNLIGSILYPFMVAFTNPIASVISNYVITKDFYLILLFAVILYGVSSGLIYRSGYTTGGSDIIMQIINKYAKISESKAMVAANAVIIVMGMFVFGFEKGIYSFIILACSTYFVDKMMFGISDSKVFYIYTKKIRKIKNLILQDLESGFTILPSRGGFTKKSKDIIMCVVANGDYYSLKQKVLEIDPDAFIVINSCYEVNGGVRRSGIPFL